MNAWTATLRMDPRKHCFTEPATEASKARCVRKQNLLVYDKSNLCVAKSKLPKTCYITPLKKANPKKIRVCTGADLKRMCPPKLCACPTKRAKNTGLWASLGRLLGFGVKGALAGGLIYWTYGIGLWGKPDETEQLYIDLCKYAYKPDQEEIDKLMQKARDQQAIFNQTCDVFAYRSKQMAMDRNSDALISEDAILAQLKLCQKAPSIRDNANCFKNKWNNWIISSFAFFVNLPQRLFCKKDETKEEDTKSVKKQCRAKKETKEEIKSNEN